MQGLIKLLGSEVCMYKQIWNKNTSSMHARFIFIHNYLRFNYVIINISPIKTVALIWLNNLRKEILF